MFSLAILTVTNIFRDYMLSFDDIPAIPVLINYLPISALVTFIIFFNLGLGPIPYIILGEIFPPNIKSIASSALISLNWLTSCFVSMYVGYVLDIMGMGIMFLIFTILAGAGFLFNHFCVIETKGKSLQEIQDMLRS